MPLITRGANLAITSYDPATRTFVAVAATETPVRRYDYDTDQMIEEILVITPEAVDLSQYATGRAPLLNAHKRNSMGDQIGVIRSARIEDRQLVVVVEVSPSDDLKPIRDALEAGTARNVSVGFDSLAREVVAPRGGGLASVRVTRWCPRELSLVPLGADPNAFIRSEGGVTMPQINDFESHDDNEPQDEPRVPRRTVDPQTRAERARVSSIANIAERAGMPMDVQRRAIDDGTTVETFREAAFDFLEQRQRRVLTDPASRGSSREAYGSFDDPFFLSRSVENALYARMSGTAPEGAAREFMGQRILDMGAELLRMQGERVDASRPEYLASRLMAREPNRRSWFGRASGGMHTTSDFPVLLQNAMGRRLLDLYKAAESGASMIAAPGRAADFRPINESRLSSFPALEKVNEHGEIKFGSLQESGETLQIQSFARGISVTFQVLVNDDLDAISRSIRDIAFAANELKASLILTALAAKMVDNKTFFHADHANLGTGAVISTESVGAGRLAMRSQTAMDGKTPLGIGPKFLLVPSALETDAEKFLTALNPTTMSDANPFQGKLHLAVEPRLSSASNWFLFADPGIYPALKFLSLDGHEGPRLEMEERFTQLGTDYRVTMHCGAGPVDHRAAYKNPN